MSECVQQKQIRFFPIHSPPPLPSLPHPTPESVRVWCSTSDHHRRDRECVRSARDTGIGYTRNVFFISSSSLAASSVIPIGMKWYISESWSLGDQHHRLPLATEATFQSFLSLEWIAIKLCVSRPSVKYNI